MKQPGTISLATVESYRIPVVHLDRWVRAASWIVVGSVLGVMGCGGQGQDETSSEVAEGFQAFEASCPRENGTGAYLVEGDIAIWGKDVLLRHYQSTLGQSAEAVEDTDVVVSEQPLVVHTVAGVDAIWSLAQRNNLTYCINSAEFGTRLGTVESALATAAAAWSSVANVTFVYRNSQNSTCTAANNNVVFDVRLVAGQPYAARAFFPNYSRSQRSLLIDANVLASPSQLPGVLRHELGHVLGFRHEHTAGSTGSGCYEDPNWRALTAYDAASVMHYSSCGGTSSGLSLTMNDKNGAACLYGAAAGYTPDCTYRGVKYRAHAAGFGWFPDVLSGDIAGTVGQGRRMEAFVATITGSTSICYQAHVQGIGWQQEVCNGAQAGTIGQGRQMEAIAIRLVGAPAGCNVRYQAHVAGLGWLSAVSNNATAGTVGQGRAMEALKVWLSGSCGI